MIVLLRRGACQRELCACGLRALSEAQDRQAASLLRQALAAEEAGGPAALSAAAFSKDPEIAPILAKIAASRQSHLAFGAELARVARGESSGALLAQLAGAHQDKGPLYLEDSSILAPMVSDGITKPGMPVLLFDSIGIAAASGAPVTVMVTQFRVKGV